MAKFLFAATPLPNQPGINPLLGPNLIIPTLIPTTQNTTSIRIDHRFSDKDLIFGRFTYGTNDHWLGTTVMLPDRHRRLPEGCRRVQPALAESYRGLDVGPHLLPDPDQRSAGECVERLPVARLGRQAHQLFRGSRAAESFSGSELAELHQLRSHQSNLDGDLPVRHGGPFWLVTNYGLVQDNATKVHGKHEFQFGFHDRDEWIGKSANSTPGRSTPVHWPPRSTIRPSYSEQSAGTATDRVRSGKLRTRSPELQRRLPAPLVSLPPAGVTTCTSRTTGRCRGG